MREVLESTKQEAIRGVEEQVLLIAAGERALLPAPEGSGDNADASQVLAHYTARLDEHFQKQAAILEPLAAEREQILEERFATSAKIVYHPETVSYTPKLILEIKHGDAPVWLMFEFSGDSVKGTHLDGLEELAKPEIAREWIGRGYTILSFQAIKGIDFRSQLDRVLTLHAEKLAALTMQHTIEIAS